MILTVIALGRVVHIYNIRTLQGYFVLLSFHLQMLKEIKKYVWHIY